MTGACCAKLAILKKAAAVLGLTAVVGSGAFYGAYRMGWVSCPCTGMTYEQSQQAPAEVKPQNP